MSLKISQHCSRHRPQHPVAPPTPVHIEEPINLKQHMADTERSLIISALEQTGWVNCARGETSYPAAHNAG
jgi:transcriptional regulator with GAF, ATPase, and Fis domain